MKKVYFSLLFILFLAAGGFRANAVCPVGITAGGPVIFCTGDSVLLTASTGVGYLYQWKRNNIAVAGATSQTFYPKTTGSYTVTVTVVSPACTTTSGSISVTAEAPLTVTITQPGFGMCGSSTDILEAPFGSSYIYQWYEDNNILPLTNNYQLQTGHNGNYTVAVTNTCGTYTSPTYILFDTWLDAHPYGWIYPNGSTSFCTGGGVTLYSDNPSFSGYQWYKDGVALPGEISYSYTATTAGSYMVRITDYCWWNGTYFNFYSNIITTTILPGSIPTATISAAGPISFCAGGSVTLHADSAAGWNYQWRKSSLAVGSNTPSYVATSAGNYTCIVSNTCGSVLSNTIIVEVIPATVSISLVGPSTICNGATATMNASSAGTGATYQWKLNGSNIAGATGTSYAAAVQGIYTCTATNICGTFTSNAITIIISGTCSTGLQFDGINDYAKVPHHTATDFGTGNFTVEAWVNLDVIQTGTSITVISNRVSNTSGLWVYINSSGRLAVFLNGLTFNIPINLKDNTCHHIAVSRTSLNSTILYVDGVLRGTFTSTTGSVTTTGSLYIGNDFYYSGTSFAALRGNIMEVRLWNVARTLTDIQNTRNTTLAGTEPGLVGYFRLDDGTGQIINDYSSTNNDGQLGSTLTADINDPVFAGACALSGCTLPPSVITAGGPVTFCAGGSVTLTANTGAGLNYTWRRNGIILPGAAGSSYIADTSGSYSCTVSNACGSTISNFIVVEVVPVSVSISTVATTFCSGASVTLSATNAGAGGTYQWKLNGVNIPGAQSQTYIDFVAGTFTCSITNSCGTFLSNALVMTVDPNCSTGLQFDGINDRVSIPDSALYNLGTGDFTAEAWIKADTTQPFGFPIIFGKRGTSSDGFIVFLTNGQLSLQVGGINVSQAGLSLLDNACHHVAVTRTGSTIRYYVDGVTIYTSSSGFGQSISSTHQLWIGADQPNPNYFKGLIHEVRFWNLSRTQSQIVSAKDTFLTGNESGLIGYWRMNDGNSQSVNDYSTHNIDGFLGSTSAVETNDPSFVTACPLTGCSRPAATITATGPTTFCTGSFVTLNAITGAGLTYQWKINGGNISGATSSTYAASIAGLYSCVVTNACGSSTSGTITVTVVPPTATITAGGSTTFCTGGSVTLNANTGTGFTWQWRLNGGNISGATLSSYVATAAGNYTCVITNVCGTLTSNTITVTVNTPPAATITAVDSTGICTGGSVTLNANTGTGLTYQWKLNGGNISGATTSSYVATAVGNYTCVVTNSCGGTTSNTITVTVNTGPTATISASGPLTFCIGGSVTLNANTSAGVTYQWRLNGGNIPGATSSSYVATAAGNYTCAVTNSCGSTTSNTIVVTVNAAPIAAITASGPTTFCAGGSVTLNASPGAGQTYQWRLNGINIPGASASAFVATSAGSYTCVVTNSCGSATSNTIVVTVNAGPAATISAGGITTFCNGGSVILNANTGAGLTYQWQLNSSPIAGATTSSFVASVSGSYTCVVTNSCGSITSNSVAITVETMPVATLSALGSTTVCSGDSVLLEVTNGSGYSYQYRLNGVNIPGATSRHWPAFVAGNYSCLVSNSCGSILTNVVAVTVVAGPPAVITAAGSTSFCPGGSVTLNANTGAGLSYQWKRNGINISGATANFYTAITGGNYTCLVSYTCGSTLSNSIPVTLLSNPAGPGAISGLASGICGNTTSYSIPAVQGASTYNWTVPAGVTINSGQGTTSLNVTYPIPFATGSISVNATNTCGTGASSGLSLSSALAPTGTISGLTVVCAHKSYIYSIAPVPGATQYTWTVPTKAKISPGGQGTPVIEVKFSKTGGSITVTASNACTTSTTSVLPILITEIGCGPVHRTYAMLDAEVYPNPSSSYFTMTVYSEDESPCLFILRDLTGRVLERRESISPGEQINFGSRIANGIYLVEIQQGEERKVIRVVKSE